MRKKAVNVQRIQPITLYTDDVEQQRLWLYYQKLTEKGQAADWIRATLIAAVPPQPIEVKNGN